MKNILLIGAGRFGRHTARHFFERGHQVMCIDQDEEQINAILPYVTNALIGDATKQSFMETVGVSDFDVCIVAIGDDFQSSLETTALLKDLGAKFVVSRAARDVHAKFLLRNGADEIIYPERQLAEWTAIRYGSDHILDFIALEGPYSIYEVELPDQWVGKTLIDLDLRRKSKVNVIAVRQAEGLMADVNPDSPFQKGQTLLVIGRDKDVEKCFRLNG